MPRTSKTTYVLPQNKDVEELSLDIAEGEYEVEEDRGLLILSPTSTSPSTSRASSRNEIKKRKKPSDEDAALLCLKEISGAAASFMRKPAHNVGESEDQLFGRFIGKTMENIKNKKDKLTLQKQILDVVYQFKLDNIEEEDD